MSLYSAKTGLSSILKTYSPVEREKAKSTIINKVRFSMPMHKSLTEVVESVLNVGNYVAMNEYVSFLKEGHLNDEVFVQIITEARRNVHLLQPTLSVLVETLLSLDWRKRSKNAIQEHCEFHVDILVAHSSYTSFAISKLISNWVPNEKDVLLWKSGIPHDELRAELDNVHKLLERLLNIIPMTFDVVLDAVSSQFPYYKKPTHLVGGYLHNTFRLLEYKPAFTTHIMELLFSKLLVLDVNAPRQDIEDAEYAEEDIDDGAMFPIEGCDDLDDSTKMKHPIAETLDVCLELMFSYIQKFADSQGPSNCADIANFFKLFFATFEKVVLPSHNTHYVQFLMFYLCSFKPFLSERFLNNLWAKTTNPNISAWIRQTSVGYIASFLARSKFISMGLLQNYLAELSAWAHNYIQQSDSVRSNMSLKANMVFYSVCQAVFYVVAFRSRDLTRDKESLLFLQSLQLSAIVTSNFNPLRVCIAPVATAFAGVTRTYQLAYCHAILERNARRKLATVYANETSMPEERLETFFPFDPYLLKKSGKRISPIYLQYHAEEADEEVYHADLNLRRKRVDSEVDEVDDFIVDKKQKMSESLRDKELQFTYGLSPGFHV